LKKNMNPVIICESRANMAEDALKLKKIYNKVAEGCKMKKVLVINGPNLNLLGIREKNIYGEETLEDIARKMNAEAEKLNVDLSFVQSNHEGR